MAKYISNITVLLVLIQKFTRLTKKNVEEFILLLLLLLLLLGHARLDVEVTAA